MASTVENAHRSDLVGSLDNIRPRQAKAGLASDQIGPRRTESMNAVMKQAVLRHFGSVKEAAYALGQVDPSLMMREFDAGKFGRVNDLEDREPEQGANLNAAIAMALFKAFGSSDPKSIVLRELRVALERIAEAMSVVERIA